MRAARVGNPQPPGTTVALATDIHVAARLDHEVPQSAIAKDPDRAVDRVALADAAEVDAHAFARQEYRPGAIVDLDGAIVHQLEPALDGRLVWNRVVLVLVELPDVGQRSERDVEGAVGPFADLARDVEYLAYLGCNRHRLLSGGRVDAHDVAAGAPVAHLGFETFELGEHRIERGASRCFVGRRGGQVQLRTHRHADALDRPGPSRIGRLSISTGDDRHQRDRKRDRAAALEHSSHRELQV